MHLAERKKQSLMTVEPQLTPLPRHQGGTVPSATMLMDRGKSVTIMVHQKRAAERLGTSETYLHTQ